MQMTVVVSTKERMVVAEVSLGKVVDLEVLATDVMKIVRRVCTMVVHSVLVLISLDLVKNLVKRAPDLVLTVPVRVKTEDLAVNQGLNSVKNSQKAN